MKNVIFFALAIVMLCGTSVMADNSVSYLKTGDKIYYGQTIKTGMSKTKIIAEDGTIVIVPNSRVDAYMADSRLFELMPVSIKTYGTVKKELMEKIKSREGLVLYRYCSYDNGQKCDVYYVFNGENIHLICDKTNTASVLGFFGININE